MKVAPHVYTQASDLQRLRGYVADLDNGAHVELELADGERVAGIVAARPQLLTFLDAAGVEGTNGSVRIEMPALNSPEATAGPWDIWLDRIVRIRRLAPVGAGGARTLH